MRDTGACPCARRSLALLAGESPAWVRSSQPPSTDPTRGRVTGGVRLGVGTRRAVTQVKICSSEIPQWSFGRPGGQLSRQHRASALARMGGGTGVEVHGRASNGMPGTWEAQVRSARMRYVRPSAKRGRADAGLGVGSVHGSGSVMVTRGTAQGSGHTTGLTVSRQGQGDTVHAQ
jgi:hypothetical protein